MYQTQIQYFTIFENVCYKLAHEFAALHLRQDRRKKLTANCPEAVESVSRRHKRIGSSDFQPSLATLDLSLSPGS